MALAAEPSIVSLSMMTGLYGYAIAYRYWCDAMYVALHAA